MNIFISGHSAGLGNALCAQLLKLAEENRVYGLSRRTITLDGDDARLYQKSCDLRQLEHVNSALQELLASVESLDLVILNAGVLGPIDTMANTSMQDINAVMDVNVWSNKIILDYLLQRHFQPAQIIIMSSGASVKGGYGWSAYALSKATVNMLAKLYAHEFTRSHICALAPGIVDTNMQSTIADDNYVDAQKFSDFKRLREAKALGSMPSANKSAANILQNLPKLTQFPSGSYIDIRQISQG